MGENTLQTWIRQWKMKKRRSPPLKPMTKKMGGPPLTKLMKKRNRLHLARILPMPPSMTPQSVDAMGAVWNDMVLISSSWNGMRLHVRYRCVGLFM